MPTRSPKGFAHVARAEGGSSVRPLGKRPALLRTPTNEDLIDRLRTSLLASTPSYPGEYREGPPSSSASSCGVTEPDVDSFDEDDSQEPASATEWERWIDWHRVDQDPGVQRMEAMHLG